MYTHTHHSYYTTVVVRKYSRRLKTLRNLNEEGSERVSKHNLYCSETWRDEVTHGPLATDSIRINLTDSNTLKVLRPLARRPIGFLVTFTVGYTIMCPFIVAYGSDLLLNRFEMSGTTIRRHCAHQQVKTYCRKRKLG